MERQQGSLESIVETLLNGRKRLEVLDAGCGAASHFSHRSDSHLVGIDISREQLEKNTALHERILGDVQEYPLHQGQYDIITCWDVLEHLSKPKLALNNFAQAIKNGGLIVLASPNVLSLRGLLTKFTPHWIHVWYYRFVVGLKDAGKPGRYPFESYHRFAMSPPAIKKFARKHNLAVEFFRYNSWDHPEYKYRLFMIAWRATNKVVHTLSFGAIGTDEFQGFQIILRKAPGDRSNRD